MILITGHQRSGTGYMAALCRSLGFAVGHERVLADGVSSFQFAVATDTVCFHTAEQNRGRNHYDFDVMIHVVRHPLGVIASTAFTDMNGAIDWQAGFIDVDLDADPVRQAVQTYIGWNRLIEPQADVRIPVERAAEELPIALRMYEGTGEHDRCPAPTANYNGREHRSLTWAEVQHAAPDLTPELMDMADRYGYTT